jgi:hypothetical protein
MAVPQQPVMAVVQQQSGMYSAGVMESGMYNAGVQRLQR